MIHVHIRRTALIIQRERGGSLQDILQEMVDAAGGARVPFSEKMICRFCGSLQVLSLNARPALGITVRSHRCDFCGATFQSEEKTGIKVMSEQHQEVETKQKKRHYKNRKR